MNDFFEKLVLADALRREAMLSSMLEQWVSELTPIILMRNGHIVGLGAEEHGVTATDAAGRVLVVIEAPECDCSQFSELCSPIHGHFGCYDGYHMPPRPKNCRIFSQGTKP